MATRSRAEGVLGGLAGVLALPILLAFGAPTGVALLGALAVLGLAAGGRSLSAVALVLSSVVSLVLCSLVVHATGLDEAIYFRPHERFATWNAHDGHAAYRPGVHLDVRMRHGDLQAMTRESIAEPRVVTFRTDAAGFRNDADYAGEPWVAVGDSFVAGSGTSQPDLLTAQLARRGVSVYNLGFPGGIGDYEACWRAFRRRHGPDARVLLFLFEGNDFPDRAPGPPRAAWRERLANRWREVTEPLRSLPVRRVMRSLWARALRGGAIARGEQVMVRELAGGPVAFYVPYVARSRSAALEDMTEFDAALERLAPDVRAVFFVPTKYRIYRAWVDPDAELPHAAWSHLAGLCRRGSLSCVDLTPALEERAAARVAEGRLLWWRDDTHWNAAGIEVAAEVVAGALADGGRASGPPRRVR